MPRPSKEPPALTAEQEWFLKLLDQRFEQQDQMIRQLLDDVLRGGGPRGGPLGPHGPRPKKGPKGPEDEVVRSGVESEEVQLKVKDKKEPRPSQKPRGTLAKVMGEVNDPPVKAWVKGSLDGYMGIIVVVNLILMMVMAQVIGARADFSLQLSSSEPGTLLDDIFVVLDYIFFAIYVLDVFVRVVVLRQEWYYDHVEGVQYMNIFDAVLVIVHGLELLLLPMILTSANQEQSASSIRVIKLVRIVRTLRIVKTVSLFRQLRFLVATCIASIGALFWSMVLLFMLKVGFALIVCQALQGYILDDAAPLDTRLEMNNLYGSFSKSLYTTFEITHSGSWPAKVRPVIEKVSFWYAIPFLAYITLVVFAVIRIVTALFLQETLASAANDADIQLENSRRLAMEYQKKLEELFQVVDNDGDGSLTPEEFVEAMSLPNIQRYLNSLDVRIQDCRPLFDILDDGDGHISVSEFCKGLMQLKGQARALDIHMLHRENSKVLKECQDIHLEMTRVSKALTSS